MRSGQAFFAPLTTLSYISLNMAVGTQAHNRTRLAKTPLTRPAPAGESAGPGPPSPTESVGSRFHSMRQGWNRRESTVHVPLRFCCCDFAS
jgi:hypothetical protein